jgi:hypothetical protein
VSIFGFSTKNNLQFTMFQVFSDLTVGYVPSLAISFDILLSLFTIDNIYQYSIFRIFRLYMLIIEHQVVVVIFVVVVGMIG